MPFPLKTISARLSPEQLKNVTFSPGMVLSFGAGRGHKFNASRTEYAGKAYASKAEAEYAFGLDCRLKAGEIASWRPQVRIPLEVNGSLVCTFVVDFEVTHPSGAIEWVEVKGFETAAYKLKRKLLEACHGKGVLTVVKA